MSNYCIIVTVAGTDECTERQIYNGREHDRCVSIVAQYQTWDAAKSNIKNNFHIDKHSY